MTVVFLSLDFVTKMIYNIGMEEKRKRGRPPKFGEAMTGAERTQLYRERKRIREHKFDFQNQEVKWAKQKREKRKAELKKTIRMNDSVVKEYLTEAKLYRFSLKMALTAIKDDKFSPESYNIINKFHKEILFLQDELNKQLKVLNDDYMKH